MKKNIFIFCILLICSSFNPCSYLIHRVYFEIGSTEINEEGGKELFAVYSFLKTYPQFKIIFEGYTDQAEVLNKEEAMELSLKRTQVCKDYLIERMSDVYKIEEQIMVKGYGYEQLCVPETVKGEFLKKNREINRRVEIRVTR
ncbi:OmpA family protein [Bernardetia sp. OM2101]|uniref:OmpA family protein n=1 Tax=Bernardetia sp. OM2101 TaxID=3344876 RepID=UPI0035CEA70C